MYNSHPSPPSLPSLPSHPSPPVSSPPLPPLPSPPLPSPPLPSPTLPYTTLPSLPPPSLPHNKFIVLSSLRKALVGLIVDFSTTIRNKKVILFKILKRPRKIASPSIFFIIAYFVLLHMLNHNTYLPTLRHCYGVSVLFVSPESPSAETEISVI